MTFIQGSSKRSCSKVTNRINSWKLLHTQWIRGISRTWATCYSRSGRSLTVKHAGPRLLNSGCGIQGCITVQAGIRAPVLGWTREAIFEYMQGERKSATLWGRGQQNTSHEKRKGLTLGSQTLPCTQEFVSCHVGTYGWEIFSCNDLSNLHQSILMRS